MTGERVEFASRRGNILVGDLHRTGDRCGPTLMLCHGMESTRGGRKQTAIVERFVPAGYSVLRFDFTYVGESEGSFGGSGSPYSWMSFLVSLSRSMRSM